MTLDVAGLAGVAALPLVARVWLRHCYLPPVGDPDPLWHDPASPSRWQTAGGTVYVGDSPETVWAEMCRNDAATIAAADPTGGVGLNPATFGVYAPQPVGLPVPARALYAVDVALAVVADLASAEGQQALQACGVADPATELVADGYGPCPGIAEAGNALGWQAVRAPSAAAPSGVALAIFAGAWPPPGAWRLEILRARPKIATAWQTRYRVGQRPAWLGSPPP